MCQYKCTFYACGEPFVNDSWYKLCADRPHCEKTMALWEWNTLCPCLRKFLEGAWNRSRPKEERHKWHDEFETRLPKCCCQRMWPEKFEGLCHTCNPAGVTPGRFHRCSPECRAQPARLECPPEDPDPRIFFEWYMAFSNWPKTHRARYERWRDEKEPKGHEAWASSFCDS
ncbi:hypothetical protein PG996_009413 [Apiospora saccharicola]|uniref:Uncharacterized protein n=1 Tax=Apiospora saccharicola TaxID=335842 RepID=A0ABR1UKQ6_9PEZI